MHEVDTTAEFFESMYIRDADPWNFAGSAYELARYAATLQAIAGRRYASAFEPGCSVGVLTEQLATLCDRVEAIDISPTAVERARARCASLLHVQVEVAGLPDRLDMRPFDLVVLSEIGYYFAPEQWSLMSATMVQSMHPGTILIGVHWLGISPDHRLSGDAVHQILKQQKDLQMEHSERHESFRLDRWVKK